MRVLCVCEKGRVRTYVGVKVRLSVLGGGGREVSVGVDLNLSL